jgi:hypothetical protein
MTDFVLEVEYRNERHHTAFMTGQIRCKDGGAGEIKAELFDADGEPRFDLGAGVHQHADSHIACNTLTMPVPPRWSVKCYKLETEAGIETSWAEID